jgi:hypothetical protein
MENENGGTLGILGGGGGRGVEKNAYRKGKRKKKKTPMRKTKTKRGE